MASKSAEGRAPTFRQSALGLPKRAPSSGLGIAAVTAVLKSLVENELAERRVPSMLGGDAIVSVLAPDRMPSGPEERAQLNLFLYHVAPYSAMRIADTGASRGLGVELRYLLSAHGSHDYQAEILLGHALQLMHARPRLTADQIRDTLQRLGANGAGRTLSAAQSALGASDLADRVGRLEIATEFPSPDEMSRLWSSLQARYRVGAILRVSAVVLGGPDLS
jgi:hypothetical protein